MRVRGYTGMHEHVHVHMYVLHYLRYAPFHINEFSITNMLIYGTLFFVVFFKMTMCCSQ